MADEPNLYVFRHAAAESAAPPARNVKRNLELDQENAIEFMKREVSSEIENRMGIKDSRGKTNERNISLLCAVCRLDDVVSERSPSASL